MSIYCWSLTLIVLSNLYLFPLFGQEDSDTINIKLFGGGQNYYIVPNTAGGNQRNDYEINMNFDITALPIMTSVDGSLIYDIVGLGGEIKIDCDIKDDTEMMSYGVEYSRGYYISSDVSLGTIYYSPKEKKVKSIQFSIPRTEAKYKRNTEITYQDDSVYVDYDFDFPILEDIMIVPGFVPSINGIFLQILETNDTENVKYVGYTFRTKDYQGRAHERKIFPIINTSIGRFAFINKFEDKSNISGKAYKSDFDDEIFLYDENKNKIGHMYYEYEYALNKVHVRNAILILHNDKDINQPNCADFPYGTGTTFDGWNYYNQGEFPVSMLIPPLNKFPEDFSSKEPLLLLHGLAGKYAYSKWKYLPNPYEGELADPKGEDVSYWYTTPRILNNKYNYNTWQMYYPNNDGAATMAECLRYDLSYLYSLYGRKINLVTHSYGGIVSMQYLTKYIDNSKEVLKKVLFMAPPFHGSYSANIAYENIKWLGSISALDGHNRAGLCYRDASLGSEVVINLWNKTLPDLNNSSFTYDDYFIIIGVTNKKYTAERIHEEAKNHNDGLVAMSSASLLDKRIGFATLYGNHDDLLHAQSNHPEQINIGRSELIPNIINDYFTCDSDSTDNEDDFLKKISVQDDNKDYNFIKAIVKHDKSVIKSREPYMSLSNLETDTDENYQRSLICLDIINEFQNKDNSIPENLYAYYNYNLRTLELFTTKKSIPKLLAGTPYIGEFRRNKITGLYYFHENWSGSKYPTKISDGCAIDLKEDFNNVKLILDNDMSKQQVQNIYINYCQSHLITFDINDIDNTVISNGKSNIKNGFFSFLNFKSSSFRKTEFNVDDQTTNDGITNNINLYVDNQTSNTTFLLTKVNDNELTEVNLQQPNGEILNKQYWSLDTTSNLYSIKIDNPMPGTWLVWAEDSTLENDTLYYQAQALYNSDIILYNNNKQETELTENFELFAELALPDQSLLSENTLEATIISPNGSKNEITYNSKPISSDSSFIFSLPMEFDSVGVYSIMIECTGIYNAYNFERAISFQLEVFDSSPKFYIPDLYLDGLNSYKEIRLKDFVHCKGCDKDSYEYSYNVLAGDDIIVSIDSLSVAFITTNFDDTSSSVIEFIVKDKELIVSRDTTTVYKTLPDIEVLDFSMSDTQLEAGKDIPFTCNIINKGNSYTNNSSEVGIYLSKDNVYDSSDELLTNLYIDILSPLDTINYSKNIEIPGGISKDYYYLLASADKDSLIYDANRSNNTLSEEIEFTPQTNFKLMITVDKESGELLFIDPNPNYPGTISYNGYKVSAVPWWDNYYLWAYSNGSALPVWVNYQFNINNLVNLDSAQVVFRAQGTTSNGVFYSYLYQQINNIITCSGDQQLINAAEWTTYGLMLDKSFFREGTNNIKIGTSASSQTYVALNGIAIEFYYSLDSSGVNTEVCYPTINENDILIYPNPTNDVLYMQGLDPNTDIEMYDINGRVIMMKRKSETQFDISHLEPGLFFIRVTSPKGIFVRKIVKL